MTDTEKSISNLKDDFPTGLTYVTGSSSGITTSDPALVAGDLSWNLTGSEGSIPSFTNKTLQFKMQGSLAQGVYCNDIWVVPGGDKTRSGLTAKIIVGSPASTLCPGTAIRLAKTVSPQIAPANIATTFTYTLTFTSDGTDSSNVSKIVDLLPAGFNYVAGSIKIDDVSYSDPAIVLKNNGTQQQLTWSANPIMTIASGATRVVTFKTTAVVSANDYYNESSATVSGLNYDLYTWPTARVQVMGVVKLSATDGKSTTESEVWLGTNTVYISSWGVRSN